MGDLAVQEIEIAVVVDVAHAVAKVLPFRFAG
jgi:hypothetical protein